jgi:ABC-type multidrug transport system ATPase subunit
MTITWENMNAYVPEASKSFLPCFKKKVSDKPRHIMQNVNGIANPGEVLAIMGASGAGKTTLLNALTFRNRGDLQLTGDVKINGRLISDSKQFASISGYVQQNDIFIGTLKVKEHLRFQVIFQSKII